MGQFSPGNVLHKQPDIYTAR